MNTQTIVAKITARGANSTVPDNKSAVDAVVYAYGVEIGAVTLLADHTGDLVPWGSLDNWADNGVQAFMLHAGSNRETVDAITDAVRKAART